MDAGTVLIVDDDAGVRKVVAGALVHAGYHALHAADADDALFQLKSVDALDAVVTDVAVGKASGLELCRRAKERRPDVPILVLTARRSLDLAVEALRAGAIDFLQKPVDVDLVVHAVGQAVENRRLRQRVKRLEARVGGPVAENSALIGNSPGMDEVRSLIRRLAKTPSSVLISGESGTGKEMVAEALHRESDRADGPFVAVNCTALPDALLESQLFGHMKGAFTDARSDQRGLFLEADGGTLFLDEIGDMPAALQPKLLRVLQQRTVRPLGGSKDVPFDVRIVAATHQDMEQAVEAGRFREDLYYRLNVVQLDLPPLRVRGNDVLELAQHFIALHGERLGRAVTSISPAAARALLTYTWPGNVRELSNCIERAVALAELDHLSVDDLPPKITRPRKASGPSVTEGGDVLTLDEVERRHILQVLKLCDNSRAQTARALGIDRKTLYRKLQAYGLKER